MISEIKGKTSKWISNLNQLNIKFSEILKSVIIKTITKLSKVLSQKMREIMETKMNLQVEILRKETETKDRNQIAILKQTNKAWDFMKWAKRKKNMIWKKETAQGAVFLIKSPLGNVKIFSSKV